MVDNVCVVEAILGDEVYKDMELVEVVAAEISNKSETSRLIRELTKDYPINELGHLKRVKCINDRLYILVDVKTDINTSDENMKKNVKLNGLSNFSVVKVPRTKPVTRQQFETSRLYWPTQFHEDKRLEKMLKKELFSPEEAKVIAKFMRHALDEAHEKDHVGALIVDPAKKEIVARASSSSNHPLQHAAMRCIDAVAASQGGGAWTNQEVGFCSYFLHSNETDENDREDDNQELPEENDREDDNQELPLAKRMRFGKHYLCTGFDVYLTTEPCVMCAMGLLHSRVKRVFYSKANVVSGALESWYKIHLCHKLNHHFEAFRVTMMGETV